MTAGRDLDLSWGAELRAGIAELYDRLCEGSRNEFVAFVDSVSEHAGNHIDWWVEGPASRNHILSPLFHNFIALKLLRECLAGNAGIDRVYVDSAALHEAAKGVIEDSGAAVSLQYRHGGWKRLVRKARSFASPIRSMGRLSAEWAIIRMTRRGGDGCPVRGDIPYILLDTFILPPGPKQSDRYYPGLLEHVPERDRARIRFVPQFFGFELHRLAAAVREARREGERFLIKEDLLRPGDLVWCFLHWVRLRRVDVGHQAVDGIDMAPLILEELRSGRSFRCAVRGLMNYRFAAALKRAGATVSDVIDWFENHPMDRGWNAGFHRHYRHGTRIAGYMGFYPAFPAARPTPGESAAKVIPDRVLVTGPGLERDVREFLPALETGVAPAFRYQWIFDSPAVMAGDATRSSVVVALPYDESSVAYMLDTIGDAVASEPDFELLVKAHPAMQLDSAEALAVLRRPGIRHIEGDLRTWFTGAFAVVCGGMSTSSLEAIASGLPVAVIARPGRCHEVSLPSAVPREMWRVCRTAAELAGALKEFQGGKAATPGRPGSSRENVCNSLFTPVTRESVVLFLSLRPPCPPDRAEITGANQ